MLQRGAWKRYNAKDPIEGLLQQVKLDLSMDAAAEFTCISTQPGERCVQSKAKQPVVSAMHASPSTRPCTALT